MERLFWHDVASDVRFENELKKRTVMTHRLAGGGGHNMGYDALQWDIFCTAIVEHMASTRSFLFFLTRLRATCLNSTQNPTPVTICPKFLMIQANN